MAHALADTAPAGEAPAAAPPRLRGRWALVVLVALLVWVPLPLGSNRPLAWIALEVVAMTTAAAMLLSVAVRAQAMPAAVRAALVPLLLMALWLAYLALQIVPLGQPLVAWINPGAEALRGFALSAGDRPASALSIDPATSLVELRKALAYVSVFVLVLLVIDTRQRLRAVAVALVVVATLIALYGLVVTLTGIERIWWMPKTAYRGFVSGTFVNRNHFATFMGLGLAMGLGLVLSRYSLRLSGYSTWRAAGKLANVAFERDAWLVPALLIMLAALVLTASRGGTTAFALALLAGSVIAALARGWHAREVRLLPLVVMIAVAAIVWLGPGELPARFQDLQDQRLAVWSGTLKLVSHYPLTGAGNGSFEHLFPLYGSPGLHHFYDHAHNDYLEVAAEQGIVGITLLGLVLLSVMVRVVTAIRRRQDPLCRGIAFAALIGMLAMMLHAVVDFPFEIPALSAWFFALMGLALVAGSLPSGAARRGRTGAGAVAAGC